MSIMVWPSLGGSLLAAGVISAFLAYRPAKLLYTDLIRGRRFRRTRVSLALASILGLVAAALLVTSAAVAGPRPFVAFLFAAPFALVFVAYDLSPGRFWQAEVAAPLAFASSAAAVVLAGAGSWRLAGVLWVVVTARSLPSVFYVRARLRLERGTPARTWLALVAQSFGLVVVTWMATTGWLPPLAIVAMAILLARASFGLSPLRRKASASAIGMTEIGWGVIAMTIVATGFWLGS